MSAESIEPPAILGALRDAVLGIGGWHCMPKYIRELGSKRMEQSILALAAALDCDECNGTGTTWGKRCGACGKAREAAAQFKREQSSTMKIEKP